MPKVLLSDLAKFDLEDIWSYIAQDNAKAADSLYDSLFEKFHVLSESPEIGRSRQEIDEGVRSLAVGNYVIFYRIVSEGVFIARVLHGKRDVPTVFESEE